ncbi:MAG: hypothetical protein IKZ33_08365, partial [Lentisphaeria bacterium]|nr:hypothetical protein [Lentisphaeria bacterium]
AADVPEFTIELKRGEIFFPGLKSIHVFYLSGYCCGSGIKHPGTADSMLSGIGCKKIPEQSRLKRLCYAIYFYLLRNCRLSLLI